jgi:hypothetical protein
VAGALLAGAPATVVETPLFFLLVASAVMWAAVRL